MTPSPRCTQGHAVRHRLRTLRNTRHGRIRFEESHYSNMIPTHWLYGTRIIKQTGEYKIDVIVFKKFFKVDRDRLENP